MNCCHLKIYNNQYMDSECFPIIGLHFEQSFTIFQIDSVSYAGLFHSSKNIGYNLIARISK